ncbi:HIT family hydrolase, diadenosine tetraphosphate hydrolase [Frankia casuarinae]|jgi:diadenosine tetraphosphate (Ap4A) HIT family hydrolase|uniref:HIT domain-containing protein n=1 Tax=Frankia casuarinae (strain DSM 45818 / CECT 9043 / HFP020203 / CcI3) TaxID=106370 RepID=Q2JC09_FRACC|nr:MULTISPECIES: hypothetical protein [Frankia]ABD11183.1 hypothetical protein Francci3_1807 [Frankia casuarinae]ETA00838.1 HIT family hydrolase, diadenosine tetraphosphate hydrolase [Frankia sp. CcI6]EYT91214.1 HIT family hydrolase, diadenosine tetraphosphate hydrolase [Frankia casuarinae]KFB03392.1 HIT family hydrolase, diadenosine tetraphosphate hydrolase [Frankia sp. Allo2]
MPSTCDLCDALDPAVSDCALQRHLTVAAPRILAANAYAAAVPTIGAYVAGYLLLVPRSHVLSLGALDRTARAGVDALMREMAARLADRYDSPVLGFEYGLNAAGQRRIEHGHLHLLPTEANLRGWLAKRLTGHPIASLVDLPADPAHSYILVRDQSGALTVYPVPTGTHPRIRLRHVVAALDPRLDGSDWDWESDPHADLMRRTVDDLAPTTSRPLP